MGKDLGNSTEKLSIDGEDENKERGNWSGKLDFLLSCIGYAVGLGNVWRFPYLAYDNGGGAFLIPYVIMLLFCGLPLFFMELAVAQFCSKGAISIWIVSPLFTGLGYAMCIISGLVCIYYNVIICWAIFYLFASFTSKLPWESCGNAWNTAACIEGEMVIGPDGNLTKAADNVTYEEICAARNASMMMMSNTTGSLKTPSEEYWENFVLDISPSIEETGTIRWQLALCLLLAWVVIFLCLCKGIKSSGKVVYFTATFPYIVLVILLIRGVTLPGYWKGIEYYVTPKWDLLLNAKIWGKAAVQIFYSLGPGFGGLHAMASYNRFKNNCYRDAVIVALINCGTSVFAGFVIFSVIGFMSHSLCVPVEDVAASGPGLAFVAYPAGIAMMPIAPLWSCLFFLMLFTLGLDSQFAMMETIITAATDEFPKLRSKKTWFTLALCISFFILGLPCVCNSGMWWLNLMDWYSAGFSLMLVALFEIVALMWVYGINNFLNDIKMMIGFRPNPYWMVTWGGLTFLTILGILVYSFIDYGAVTYNGMAYPFWGELLGWGMVLCSFIMIPLFMVIKLFQHRNDCRSVIRPTEEWGPALPRYRALDPRYSGGIPMTNTEYPGQKNPGFDAI
ncbi:unnamed protein product [Owenia fusiformis]|uniref:Transporter n=1 Tax=Owenia fusiformis TaxID=6347 RepID=A0A8J1THX4_OWEFU|nr:unnamed protein product [Owenia fusiformis]